ncbi:hypothetical protein BKH46_07275 [Helicobacter sp. 12S02634-8]|uniref:DMT family transporter n=1 Tax=Helicobacter sp. 12S02634-8 TaxID=1476199 RepID=UPI000BA533C1|nr:SMR family transporter [Helicobacter sp. 12S02634-8]PAF46536.1 hypothetical protein BKH46_07275 [Helicobacter sp. 12S02634-8]
MIPLRAYIFLSIAIFAELIATISLKASLGALWGYGVMGGFIIGSYYFMGLCVRHMPIGLAYAIWEVLGLLGIAVVGVFVFDEVLSAYQKIGIALGILGIILINIGTHTTHTKTQEEIK